VFVRTGTTWAQEAYIKASDAAAGALFGQSVSLQGDRLAVGSPKHGAMREGAVYVFRRIAGEWTEEQIVTASNPGADDIFGTSVALFGDRLAVGASQEDSGTKGVGSTPDETAPDAGAAYVFRRVGTVWSQEAYVKAANTDANDHFGEIVSLSGPDGGSGDTLVASAPFEDSNAVEVENGTGASADNSIGDSGALYVFKRTGTTWTQEAYIKSPNPNAGDNFSCQVAVSGDTIASTACHEDTGGHNNIGAAYTYVRTGTTWSFDATLAASNGEADDGFGSSVAISGDLIVVGAPGEDGGLPGINQNGNENSATNSGAAYLFRRTGPGTWVQEAYIKPLDIGPNDFLASTQGLAISDDTIVIGDANEDSNSTGINGEPNNTNAFDAGSVYIFR
jgi:hypothetical protein